MNGHLTDVDVVEYVDGSLPAPRGAHLLDCAGCRDRVRLLRESMLRVAHGSDVPEPSPLFWEHFSRRIHEAVREHPAPPQKVGWLTTPRLGWLAGATGVVLAATLVLWNGAHPSDAPPHPAAVAIEQNAQAAPDHAQAAALDIEEDTDWALVRAVADDLPWEDAHEAGIHARPGAADRVALEMSAAERQELARLIEDEMKRTGA